MIVCYVSAQPEPPKAGEEFVQSIHNDTRRVKKKKSRLVKGAECSLCYEELGRFDMCKEVFHHIRKLPQDPEVISITFTLFTRSLSPQSDLQII